MSERKWCFKHQQTPIINAYFPALVQNLEKTARKIGCIFMIKIGVLHNYFTLDCIAHIIYLQVNSGRWRLSQGEEVREKEKERDIAHHLTGVNEQVKLLMKLEHCLVCILVLNAIAEMP